jgi:hypothetical protein
MTLTEQQRIIGMLVGLAIGVGGWALSMTSTGTADVVGRGILLTGAGGAFLLTRRMMGLIGVEIEGGADDKTRRTGAPREAEPSSEAEPADAPPPDTEPPPGSPNDERS